MKRLFDWAATLPRAPLSTPISRRRALFMQPAPDASGNSVAQSVQAIPQGHAGTGQPYESAPPPGAAGNDDS